MIRDRFTRCGYCGAYHWQSEWPEGHFEPEGERSPLPRPMLIADTIDPVMSHADGKTYTSKAALRGTYKPGGNPRGIAFEEVGNETASIGSRPQRQTGITESIQKAVARYERGERPATA